MITRKITSCLCLVLSMCYVNVSAKTAGDLSAKVLDMNTKLPVEFASVEILTEKDSIVTRCITDSKGYFEITPPAKAAKFRISFMGYKTYVARLSEWELGIVYLEEDVQQLNEVTVNGKARFNKVDRDVYNITKDLRAGTVTSQELLGRLNGVTYNHYDRSITVNGSSKILILVDGIEKDQDMAKNLPADRIERVEVIKDPVGKYATDGYTAVINIILKKNFSGVDALVNNISFFDWAGSNGNDPLVQDVANMNITYTYRKLNLYASGNYYTGNFNVPTEYLKQYGDRIIRSSAMNLDDPNASSSTKNGKINFGADYSLSNRHQISADFRYAGNTEKSHAQNDIISMVNDVVLDSGFSLARNHSYSNQYQGTITYKGKLDDRNTLDADFRYSHSDGKNYNYFQQDVFTSENSIAQKGDFARFNLNYNFQFNPKINLDLGYGNVYTSNSNEMLSNTFTQKEYRNRFSAYLSYKPIPSVSAKLGGIVENYRQKNTRNDVDHTSFMPFVNLQYIPSKNFNVVAKYHASVEYPGIDQLSVFKTAQDSFLSSVGNPMLKLGMNHALSMSFNFFSFLTLTPYYTFSHSKIIAFVCEDAENSGQYLSKFVNADSYDRYGASLDFTLPLGKKIFWQNTLNYNKNRMGYAQESFTAHNFTINTSLFFVDRESGWVAGTIFQQRQAREITMQGYTTGWNNMMMLLLQKSFMQQKFNVTLLCMLPVNFISYDQPSMTRTASYYQRTNTSLELIKHLCFLQLSYRFSAGKQVGKKTFEDDAEDKKPRRGGIGL